MLNAFAAWLSTTPLTTFLENAEWAVPAIQSLHIFSIAIVFGGAAFVSLRVFGLLEADQPLSQVLARFVPPLEAAVVVLAVTGVLLIASEPNRAIFRVVFWVKMVLIAAALAATWALRRLAAGPLATASSAPLSHRLLAAASLALWIGVIFTGRWIGYVSGWPGSPT